jgi:pyruvate formate lyase activating enzyme
MKKISRREFTSASLSCSAGMVCMAAGFKGSPPGSSGSTHFGDSLWKWSKECMYYEVTPRGTKCLICPNACTIAEGSNSVCRNRTNYKGRLYTIAYGNPCTMHIDPVEKKPLFHFMPGTNTFSIATAGCNFACLNCQNWSISQASPKETRNYDLMPAKVVAKTLEEVCKSVSYTYSEPITFYEYMYDSSVMARQKGLRNIMVSNGCINEKPLRALCKVLDAASIDLKSFDESTYLKLNDGRLQPVLDALRIFRQEGVWLEISNLVIPGWSDGEEMIKKMCDWLCQNGFQGTPLHFLRFQPLYKLTRIPPTPIAVLEKSKEIALKTGIRFVYIGNIPGTAAVSTICPRCKKTIIERNGFTIVSNLVINGNCGYCGEKIPGKWK